jgi:hypothetical protein
VKVRLGSLCSICTNLLWLMCLSLALGTNFRGVSKRAGTHLEATPYAVRFAAYVPPLSAWVALANNLNLYLQGGG